MTFGAPERVFRQTVVIRLILALFVFLPLAAFLILVSVSELSRSRFPWPWLLALAVLVAALVWMWRAIGKTVLSIHGEGLRRQTIFAVRELGWDEVTEYRFKNIPITVGGALGAVGGVIEAVGSRNGGNRSLILTLMARDGRRLRLDSNLRDAAEAVDLVIQRLHERLVPALERRLAAGETLRFGPFELGPRGLADVGDEPIPFAQISVEVVGTRLRIRQAGKFFVATSADTAKIPNVVALCDLLRKQGVSVPELRPSTRVVD